ncbi:hypothetical protein RB595_002681 [Gaeumannomyces hyphopodioides]
MSLIESPSASTRDQIHSNPAQDASSSTYTTSPAAAAHPTTSQTHHRQDSFDDVIYEEFYQALEEHRQQPAIKTNMAAAAALQEARPMMFETSASDTSSTPASPPAPPLPNKNARRSRMLDGMMIKLDGHHEAATPHDVYLSSEEDASSSADDYSDYDWESSSEVDLSEAGVELCEGKLAVSPTSSSGSSPAVPQPRRSHEITARAVAVVFSGKPAMIELSNCSKRCASRSETNNSNNNTPTAPTASTDDLASSASSVMTSESSRAESVTPTTDEDESHYKAPLSTRTGSLPSNNSSTSDLSFSRRSSASSVPSRSTADKLNMNRRQSSNAMLTAMLSRQQPPPFLSIDPYANGSTYSLNTSPARKSTLSVVSPMSAGSDVSPSVRLQQPSSTAATPKTPKTPTALFKEFSRSVSNTLNRKRSRQSLIGVSTTPTSALRDSYVLSSPMPPIDDNDDAVSEYGPSLERDPATPEHPQRPRTAVSSSLQRPERRDSLRSASTSSPTSSEKKAAGPGPSSNRWSTLNVRRRSMKLANKIL